MQEISYFLWFLLRKAMHLYNMAHEKEKHDERWMGLYNAREKGMHWERNMLFFLSLLKSPSSEHKNKNENDGSMWEWNEWKKPILESVFPCNGWPMQSNVLDILFTFFPYYYSWAPFLHSLNRFENSTGESLVHFFIVITCTALHSIVRSEKRTDERRISSSEMCF